MNKTEVMRVLCNHKKEFLITAGTVVAASVLFIVTRKSSPAGVRTLIYKSRAKHIVDLPIQQNVVGRYTGLWRESAKDGSECFISMIDSISVNDLGRVGEDLLSVDGITEAGKVFCLIGVKTK